MSQTTAVVWLEMCHSSCVDGKREGVWGKTENMIEAS